MLPLRDCDTVCRRSVEVKVSKEAQAVPPETIPFKYIMTDFTQRNIDAWKVHPSLVPLVDLGLLDFALFNAEADTELRLQMTGDVLNAETLRNPMIVICNYVFDTLSAVCDWLYAPSILPVHPCARLAASPRVLTLRRWLWLCAGWLPRRRRRAAPDDALRQVEHGGDGHGRPGAAAAAAGCVVVLPGAR